MRFVIRRRGTSIANGFLGKPPHPRTVPMKRATSESFVVMGKTFDPAKPDEYIKRFAIRRA